MQIDDLKRVVPDSMRGQVDTLYQRFQDGGGDTVTAFARWLFEEGSIDQRTFRALHAGGNLVLTHHDTLGKTYYPSEERPPQPAEFLPADGPKYEVLGKLAAGAMGEIHIVRERDLQRKIALKRMHEEVASYPKLVGRFLNEAQITAQLDHPNIVPVYSLDRTPGRPLAYTMKLVRGETFARLIKDARAMLDAGMPLDDAHDLPARLEHFVRACDALAYAHSRGVVHRDLKPENIMVGAYGEVYVMDWGIAKVSGQADIRHDNAEALGIGASTKTRVGAVLGTPAYMSPEQARGENEGLDGRSDCFSLGLMLYELTCLRAAFSGSDATEILAFAREARINTIRHHQRKRVIPKALAAIIRKATALEPDDRYVTVKDLAEDVQLFLRGAPVAALPEGVLQRTGRWMSAHWQLVFGAVALTLLAAAALTIGSLGSTLYTARAASAREASLTQLQSLVATRAHRIDSTFQDYQGLLSVVAAATTDALRTSTVLDAPVYLDVGGAPDLRESPVYGRPVSLAFPTTSLAPGLTLDELYPVAVALVELNPRLLEVLLRAQDVPWAGAERAAAEERLLEEGGPIRWVFVGTNQGVSLRYPGQVGVPPGIDVRKAEWFESGIDQVEPRWGNLHLDQLGERTLLPVSMAVLDERGMGIGVAALEVGLAFIQENVLVDPQLGDEGIEAFVVDKNGGIVVRSAREERQKSRGVLRSRWLRRKKFPVAEVVAAAAVERGGYLEVMGETRMDLVIWAPMGEMGWTYVVRGPRNLLLQ